MPKIFKSVTILLLFLLVSAYACLCLFYPWRDLAALEMPAWVVRLVARIPEYVYGTERKPIVILGSSLIIAPPDLVTYEVNDANDPSWENSIAHRAIRFSDDIKTLTGKRFPVEVLASPAAMISDQCCVLRDLSRSNNMPKLLIFTVAPRDFMDNQVGDAIDKTWIRQIFPLRSRKSLIPANLSFTALSESFKSNATFIDTIRRKIGLSVKTDFQKWLASYRPIAAADASVAANTGTKTTVTAATDTAATAAPKIAADQPKAAPTPDDHFNQTLKDYKYRYDPPNYKRFKIQLDALQEMLDIARHSGVKAVIVEMPLSQENLALISTEQRAHYQKSLEDLATKYGVELEDLNSGKLAHFERADFDDSVHMGMKGGQKFIPLFTKMIVRTKAFNNAFSQ